MKFVSFFTKFSAKLKIRRFYIFVAAISLISITEITSYAQSGFGKQGSESSAIGNLNPKTGVSSENVGNGKDNLTSIDESGDLNVSIPLHTVTSGNLSLPLNLTYRSGIKVDQNASEVGLGWALSIGSVRRDYGAFEPDYSTIESPATMGDILLNLPSSTASINLSNHDLSYAFNGIDNNTKLADDYHVNCPPLGSNTFFNVNNSSLLNFQWKEFKPWKIEVVKKKFVIQQEYSRINELTNLAIRNRYDLCTNPLSNSQVTFSESFMFTASTCVPPYVNLRSFSKNITDVRRTSAAWTGSSQQVPNGLVEYEDFEKLIIQSEDGKKYVFGLALREQKYLFDENPFWSTTGNLRTHSTTCVQSSLSSWIPVNQLVNSVSGLPSVFDISKLNNASSYGEFWKIDFIGEWLLTEIVSYDYIDINNNGIADLGDAGDWIRIDYQAPVKVHKNFSQTDVASSIWKEEAYVDKIVTQSEELVFNSSQRFDIEHDYFEAPANYFRPFDGQSPQCGSGITPYHYGAKDILKIYYPINTKKYDKILVRNTSWKSEVVKSIDFKYASKGSSDELAVSSYLIRNNSDQEVKNYSGRMSNFFCGVSYLNMSDFFNVEFYKSNSNARGKTTLLGLVINSKDNIDKKTYKFKYDFNPSYNFIHKTNIIRKRFFPIVRQSLSDRNIKPLKINMRDKNNLMVVIENPYELLSKQFLTTSQHEVLNIPYNINYGNTPALHCTNYSNPALIDGMDLWNRYLHAYHNVSSQPTLNPVYIDSTLLNNSMYVSTDELGYYYTNSASIANNGRHAWSLTSIIDPMGVTHDFEYENDQSDYLTDKSTWSFDHSGPTLFKKYNALAKEKSLRQSIVNLTSYYYNSVGAIQNQQYLKCLDRTFYTASAVPNNTFGKNISGGIRLKSKKYDDGNGNLYITHYQYGSGHFASLPASYWNYLSSTSSNYFLQEYIRHKSLEYTPIGRSRYPPNYYSNAPMSGYANSPHNGYFAKGEEVLGDIDFSNKMMKFNASIRIHSNITDFHYYDVIEEIYPDNSRKKKSYEFIGNTNNSTIPADQQVFAAIRKYSDATKNPVFAVLGIDIPTKDKLYLKKVEYYEPGVNLPNRLDEYTFNLSPNVTNNAQLAPGTPTALNDLFDQKYDLWQQNEVNVSSTLYISNLNPFAIDNCYLTGMATLSNSQQVPYNIRAGDPFFGGSQFYQHFLPFLWKYSYKRNLTRIENSVDGIVKSSDFSYDPIYNQVNSNIILESCKDELGVIKNQSRRNDFTFAIDIYNQGTNERAYLLDKNLLNLVVRKKSFNHQSGGLIGAETHSLKDFPILGNMRLKYFNIAKFVGEIDNEGLATSYEEYFPFPTQTALTKWRVNKSVIEYNEQGREKLIEVDGHYRRFIYPKLTSELVEAVFDYKDKFDAFFEGFEFKVRCINQNSYNNIFISDTAAAKSGKAFLRLYNNVDNVVSTFYEDCKGPNYIGPPWIDPSMTNYSSSPIILYADPNCQGIQCNRNYIISVWLRGNALGNITCLISNGSSINFPITGLLQNEWKKYEFILPVVITNINQSLTVQINHTSWLGKLEADELLVYPEGAYYSLTMYNEFGGVYQTIDSNDELNTTRYDYWGRPTQSVNANKELVSEKSYTYINTDPNSGFRAPEPVSKLHIIDEKIFDDNGLYFNTKYFFDALGRERQVVISNPIFSSRLVNKVTEYNSSGLLSRTYNKYFISGLIQNNKLLDDYHLQTTELYADSYPYTKYDYEKKAEMRPKRITYPGNSHLDFKSTTYGTNAQNEVILSNFKYPPNELFKIVTTDEGGFDLVSYSDKSGKLVATRSTIGPSHSVDGNNAIILNSGPVQYAWTYYEYDLAGNLKLKTDPEGITTNYKYNGAGELIEASSPDFGERANRFNDLGQLRFTRYLDNIIALPNQPVVYEYKYLYNKYDEYNRLIEVGKYTPTPGLLGFFNDYTKINDPSFPIQGHTPLKKYVFDGPRSEHLIGRLRREESIQEIAGQGLVIDAIEYKYNCLGLVANKRFYFADLAGHKEINYTYTRRGQLKKLSYVDPDRAHFNFDQEYIYDRLLRLSEIKSGKPSLLQTDVKYTYDALGNLYKKQLGLPGGNFNDFVAYSYDIRGRLKENLYKDFRYLLSYDRRGNIVSQNWSNNSVDHLGPSAFRRMQHSYVYDGMNRLIYAKLDEHTTSNNQFVNFPTVFSQNTASFSPSGSFPNTSSPYPNNLQDNQVHVAQSAQVKEFVAKQSVTFNVGFRATAEAMGMVHAYIDLAYMANPNSTSLYFAPSKYETLPQNQFILNTTRHNNIYFYTKNGNISSSYIRIDQQQLSRQLYNYSTNSNKLNSVRFDAGAGTAYTEHLYNHDRNGNMLNDPSIGHTSIVYNDFDQPVTMNKTVNVSSHYRYSTAGQRLVKMLPGGARQYYLDHVVIDQNSRPLRYSLDEGHAELLVNNQVVKYIENKDWLGTIRMVRDYSGGIVGYRDHYPYGLSMAGRSLVSSPEVNRYQFTGHESDGETTLDYHGARYYSRVLGRYMSVDPMAEKYPSWSSYNYTVGNPMRFVDQNGMEPHLPFGTGWIPEAAVYMTKLVQATQRLVTGNSGNLGGGNAVPQDVKQMSKIVGTMSDAKVVAQGVVDGAEAGVNAVSSVPGAETAGDISGTFFYGMQGDLPNASYSAAAIFLPGVGGAHLRAAAKGVSVIGPRATYREFAQKIGANFLNVTDEAWTMRKNVEFLQGVVKRGDDVIFSGKFNPAKLDPNSVLGQEIGYLTRHGYSWTDDFSRMIKK
jgi:RHS repeat-associated protein